MKGLERVLLDWARSQIEPGQVSAWPLRARVERITDRAQGVPGLWVHVHDEYKWVCSVRRTHKAGNITVEVPRGTRVVEIDA